MSTAATNLNGRVAILQRPGPTRCSRRRTRRSCAASAWRGIRSHCAPLRRSSRSSGRVERRGTVVRRGCDADRRLRTSCCSRCRSPTRSRPCGWSAPRLVVAGLVALAAAAAAAYAAAYGLTRRLRMLEKAAAHRIAAGDFTAPIETGGSDEIAELAREFDLMRVRLADLDRVRREFIANASHELRTPLFSFGGFLELMADEELDADERKEFLDETRAQVTRLTRLATDLLDLSRLDAGQIKFVKREIDLTDAASTVIDEFRVLAEVSDHPLELVAGASAGAIGDHGRVLQVGRILVENALAPHAGGNAGRGANGDRRRPRDAFGPRRGPGDPRPTNWSTCFSASTAPRAARRRAPGSASRSHGSSQRAWTGHSRSCRSRGTPCSRSRSFLPTPCFHGKTAARPRRRPRKLQSSRAAAAVTPVTTLRRP